MRFWALQKGSVKLSGVDVGRVNTADLRDMESFVTQDTRLFHDSIENNLRVARLNATDEEIVAACKNAPVHDFILTLPQGCGTPVGGLGDTLSGGERQRLGLARTFLHGVGLGAAGAALPLLPSFPFLLLAAFCFARRSERLHTWITSTRLYKENLESCVQGKGMTRRIKIKIMVTATILMSIGFAMMHQVLMGRIAPGCAWVFHVLCFCLGVKTIPAANQAK